MSGTGWAISLSILYLVLIFTLALLSFRKGHWVLGLIGFVFPVLWLIGAILPRAAATADGAGGDVHSPSELSSSSVSPSIRIFSSPVRYLWALNSMTWPHVSHSTRTAKVRSVPGSAGNLPSARNTGKGLMSSDSAEPHTGQALRPSR